MEKESSQELKDYKPGDAYEVPAEGSLGLLALGYRGLEAWREAQEKAKQATAEKETGSNNKAE